MSSAIVIIPTYNEIENIHDIIEAVLGQGSQFSVLIVDDNSPDGTGDAVVLLKQSNPRIHLIKREGKLGLGTAYIAGFKYAIAQKFDLIFEMDADFSHDPKLLPKMYELCLNQADVVVGSRYVPGGNIKNWSKDRVLLSMLASFYVRIITSMPVKDPTAGFICYKRSVLETLNLEKIKFIGYSFQIEMKYYAYCLGFKIVETPITFIDREKGQSKMNVSIVSEAIKGVILMRWRKLKGYYSQ